MKNKEIAHFVVICGNVDLNYLVQQFFERNSLSYEIYSSLKDWRMSASKDRLTGVFIDFKNLMSSEQESRDWFHHIESVFPVMILMPSKASVSLKVTHKNELFESDESILGLLKKTIEAHHPRSYREHVRYDRYHRVMLRRKSDQQEMPAFISNISVGGVFVVVNCMDKTLSTQQELSILFLDLKGTPRINGNVRFIRHWDEAQKQSPGLGIQIDEKDLITLNQILYYRLNT
jgi:hypothetical protein